MVICRLVGFTVAAVVLVFPHLSRFRSQIPGNPGDAFLVMVLLNWGGDHVPSLFSGYWQNEEANAEDFRCGWYFAGHDHFDHR